MKAPILALSLAVCAFPLAAPAQQAAPTPPPFTGQPVTVVGVPDRYDPVREEIRRLEKPGRPAYYVVVVRTAGPGKDAPPRFADALARVWKDQAVRAGLPYDPDRSVLVLLPLEDRELLVRPGEHLRAAAGLTPQVIDKEVVPATFVPLARAGDPAQGLVKLLAEIDRRIPAAPAPSVAAAQPAPAKSSPPPRAEAVPPPAPPTAAPRPAEAPLRRGWLIYLLLIPLGAAVGGGIIWLRHRGTRQRVLKRFDDFKEKVIDLRRLVEETRERHRQLPQSTPEYQAAMSGATRQVYDKLDGDLNRLWDGWSRRMELWERVEGLVRTQTGLGTGRLREAENLLGGLGSFDEVDQACRAVAGQMDRLQKGHDEARAQLARAREDAGRARQQLDAVRAAGLPVEPYEAALQAPTAQSAQAEQLVSADPIGAADRLAAVRETLAGLGLRLERAVALLAQSRQAASEVEAVARDAASHRSGGLRLSEPEADPDPVLARARQELETAGRHLRQAELEPAEERLKAASSQARQAVAAIQRTEQARDRCRQELPALRDGQRRLGQVLTEARQRQAVLEREYSPASWKDVSGHVAQAEAELRQAGESLEEAARACADDVQHYLRALAMLDGVRTRQGQMQALLQAHEQTLRKLEAVRQDCQARLRQVGELGVQLGRMLEGQRGVVRAPALRRFEDARGSLARLEGQARAGRADWTALAAALEQASQSLTAARQSADEDMKAYEGLGRRLEEVETQASQVARLLASHAEDRAPANRLYEQADEALRLVRREAGGPDADWPKLLARVEDAGRDLARAEKLAHEDIRLADQAADDLEEAERELTTMPDLSRADESRALEILGRARNLLESQQYEQALEQVAAARSYARQCREEARRRAREEELRQEEERRQAQQAAAAALAASAWQSAPAAAPPQETGTRAGFLDPGAASPPAAEMPTPVEAPDPPPAADPGSSGPQPEGEWSRSQW